MLKKIEIFFKKHGVYVLVASVILILFILVLILLLRDKDQLDENGVTEPIPSEVVDPSEIPQEFLSVKQPLGYSKNYDIRLSSNIFNKLSQKEDKYRGFRIKEVDYLGGLGSFLEDINKENLEYTQEGPTPEMMVYSWQDDKDIVSYGRDRGFLFVRFAQPIALPGVDFNPNNERSLESGLTNFMENYFSSNFRYKVDGVFAEGYFQRIAFSRVLNGVPVHLEIPREYMLLTSDGRLKEGIFLLADFEEYMGLEYALISASELSESISLMEYPKTVEFEILDPEINEKYAPYGYQLESNPFTQEGTMEISDMEIAYFYSGGTQEVIVPNFIFEAQGLLDVEGDLTESKFVLIASAIESKYVYVHPDSYFENLQILE